MDTKEFLPGPAVVDRARAEIEHYNRERETVAARASWRVRLGLGGVFLGFVAAAGLLAVAVPRLSFLSGHYFALAAVAGVAAFFAHGLAMAPARRFQQSLRDRLFPIIFGFVDDLSYRNGVTPAGYGSMPQGAVGRHNRRSFDDVVSGRYQGFELELFEAKLSNRANKRTSIVFRGVVLASRLPRPFPGTLIAARPIPQFFRFFRDLFSGDGLERVMLGDPAVDERYEFRSDNAAAARVVAGGDLLKALDWLHDAWPEKPGRVAVSGDRMFVLLPVDKNFFELPHVAVEIDYARHVEPIVADIAVLVATATLMRKAMEDTP